MTNEEVNKIISEYMGIDSSILALIISLNKKKHWSERDFNIPEKLYTESLDTLVPVWEKMDFVPVFSKEYKAGWLCVDYYDYDYEGNYNFDMIDCKSSMAEAAAHAAAKEIKEQDD